MKSVLQRRCVAALCVCVLGHALPARALTATQAQALPVTALARMVLGELGDTIVDVDRPAWPVHCGGPMCPPVGPSMPPHGDAPPPLENGMTFYQRPVPALGGLRPIWLCSTAAIAVYYAPEGNVETVRLTHRFGRSQGPHAPAPAGRARDLVAEKAACGRTTSIADFFLAPDDGIAYAAGLASVLFAAPAEKSRTLPFRLTCRTRPGPQEPDCTTARRVREIAARFQVANFHAVTPLSCPASRTTDAGEKKTVCFRIILKGLDEHLIVEMNDLIEAPRILDVEYRKGMSVF